MKYFFSRIAAVGFLLLLPALTYAQSAFSGQVTDETGKAIVSVIVRLYGTANGQEQQAAYALTDRQGHYSLKAEGALTTPRLTFRKMGYADVEIKPAKTSGTHNVTMKSAPFQLREASVKAPPVRKLGDTVTYNMDAVRKATDTSVEDVLKRLPGVSVAGNGQIEYNGKPINGVQVEGLNMLGAQYAQLTQGLRPDAVQAINVYENHQPINALQGVERSDKATINLKLKKAYLSTPVGNALIGLGGTTEGGALWRGDLFALTVGKKSQHLVNAKANNAGVPTTLSNNASYSFAMDQTRTLAFPLFADDATNGYRSIGETASLNNIVRLGEEKTLRANFSQGFNRADNRTELIADYHSADQHLTYREDNQRRAHRQQLTGFVAYTDNAKGHFLTDELQVTGQFSHSSSAISGSQQASQSKRADEVDLSNYLRYILRNGRKTYQLELTTRFLNTPSGTIEAHTPASLGNALLIRQRGSGQTFYASTGTNLTYELSKQFNAGVGLRIFAQHDRFESAASLAEQPRASVNDDSGYRIVSIVSPQLTYRGFLYARLSLPVRLYNMRFRNLIADNTFRYNRPHIDPTLRLAKDLSKQWALEGTFAYYLQLGDITNFIDQPLWTDFRSAQTMGDNRLRTNRGWSVTPRLSYESVIDGRHFVLEGTLARSSRNLTGSSDVSLTESRTANVAHRTTDKSWSLGASHKRNFYASGMTFSFTAKARGNTVDFFRQNRLQHSSNTSYETSATLYVPLFSERLYSELNASASYDRQAYAGESHHFRAATGRCAITYLFTRHWEASASATWSGREMGAEGFRRDLYAGAHLRYTAPPGKAHPKAHWVVELSGNNLTNRHTQVSRVAQLSDTYTYITHLRPVQVFLTVKRNF